jgi:thiamine transport system ATP-binding protein
MIALIDALRLDERLTVLVSIHTPEDLAAADEMAFIAGGRVLAAAPPEDILTERRNPEIAAYFGEKT